MRHQVKSQQPTPKLTGTFTFTHPTGLGFVRLTDSSREEMIQKSLADWIFSIDGRRAVSGFLQGCSGRQCVTGMWDELIGRVFLLRARRQGFCAFEFLLVCSDEFEPLNWTVEYLAFISKSKDAWPCLPSTSKKRMNKLVDLAHVKSRKSRNQFRLWYQLPYWFHSTVRLRPISGATKTISI